MGISDYSFSTLLHFICWDPSLSLIGELMRVYYIRGHQRYDAKYRLYRQKPTNRAGETRRSTVLRPKKLFQIFSISWYLTAKWLGQTSSSSLLPRSLLTVFMTTLPSLMWPWSTRISSISRATELFCQGPADILSTTRWLNSWWSISQTKWWSRRCGDPKGSAIKNVSWG